MKYDRIIDFDQPGERHRVMQGIQQMRGKWRFTVKRYRKRRSDKQNAYMWGVVIPTVRDGLLEAWGEKLSADETHEYLKSLFLMKPIVNRKTGELVGTRPASSAKLNTEEFMDYIDQISKWAGEYLSVEIPLPDPEYWREEVKRAA